MGLESIVHPSHISSDFFCSVVHKVLRDQVGIRLHHTDESTQSASNGKIPHGMRGNLHVKDATQPFSHIVQHRKSKMIEIHFD